MDTQFLWSPKGQTTPQLLADICCGQMSGWVKMPLGTEVGVNPSDIVLSGEPAPLPQKGAEPPIFGPCLLWPNNWMDQDATWQGGRPQPKRHCVIWGPSSPPTKGDGAPNFWPMSIVAYCRSRLRPHARWIPSSPGPQRCTQSPNLWPIYVVAK